MRLPMIRGLIDRRILVNYRVDLDVLGKLLPKPFRPLEFRGVGVAGVCLIRLRAIRPRFLPAICGISSENAAYRVAVEWEQDGETRDGVYIPRRETSSRINTLVGGRLFPGVHHHAKFAVDEEDDRYHISVKSDDGLTNLKVEASRCPAMPPGSVFQSLREASEFFERGSIGYSDTHKVGQFDGLELTTFQWSVMPLNVTALESNYFDNTDLFPAGTAHFDCALLMRELEHQWSEKPALCCEGAAV